jgi:hypothetical protein
MVKSSHVRVVLGQTIEPSVSPHNGPTNFPDPSLEAQSLQIRCRSDQEESSLARSWKWEQPPFSFSLRCLRPRNRVCPHEIVHSKYSNSILERRFNCNHSCEFSFWGSNMSCDQLDHETIGPRHEISKIEMLG